MRNVGLALLGAANVAMGLVDLVFGNFDPEHQPIQALGNHIPGQVLYAYLTGALLVGGGLALFVPRTRRSGALVLAAVNVVIGIFWLPRLYFAPHYLGFTFGVMAGVLSGLGMQVVIVSAALLLAARADKGEHSRQDSATLAARLAIGLSAIVFGANHLASTHILLTYVPIWMPFGRVFWVEFTGIAFVLSGIAMLSGLLDALAARLLGLMFLMFSVITLLPRLAANVHDIGNWGGNAIELVMVAAAWVFAEWLERHRRLGAVRACSAI